MSRPVNVLHLIDHYRIGGPGKTILNSAKYIDNAIYKMHIGLFSNNDKDLQSDLACAARKNCIPVLILPDKRGIQLYGLKALINYIDLYNIEILHTHGYKTNLYGIATRLANSKVKIVSTYHGWIINNRKQKIYYSLDLVISILFNAIIPVSKEIYLKLPKPVRELSTTRIIHNGIVLSDYKATGQRDRIRGLYNINPCDVLIGVIGRLSREKGCLEALKALKITAEAGIQVRMIFVGEGPLQNELSQYAKGLKICDLVTFAGYQFPVQPYFEGIDMLLCPSFTEGVSNVILEAMAYKIPVVATNVGGNVEIINNKKSGMIVQAGRPKEWADTIASLIKNSIEKKRLVENAYQTVATKFNFMLNIAKTEDLYADLVPLG